MGAMGEETSAPVAPTSAAAAPASAQAPPPTAQVPPTAAAAPPRRSGESHPVVDGTLSVLYQKLEQARPRPSPLWPRAPSLPCPRDRSPTRTRRGPSTTSGAGRPLAHDDARDDRAARRPRQGHLRRDRQSREALRSFLRSHGAVRRRRIATVIRAAWGGTRYGSCIV